MNKESNTKAFKSGIWYTVGNFLSKGMVFLTTPIFTRLMTTSEVGDFANYSSWIIILSTVITLNLYSSVAVARFDYEKELDEYIASNLLLGSIVTVIIYMVISCFKQTFLHAFGFSEIEFHIAFIYFFSSPALEMFLVKNRIKYEYKRTVGLSLISIFLSTGLSLILVLLSSQKLEARIVGYYLPLIVINFVIYAYLMKSAKHISYKYWRYALNISIPLVWHTLASNLLGSSDRIMIKKMCGISETGLYSVAYTCAMVVSVLWTSMNTAWSPWAYEKMNEKNYKDLKRASKPYLLFFGFVVICFMLVSPEILWIMGGEKYASAIIVIPPVMIAYVFQFVYSLYVNIETYSKKQKYIAIGTSIAALINILLNYIFIPIFGYGAAAYTTLAGYIVLFVIHFLFVVRLKRQWWYDTKFNFIFLIVFIGVMFFFIFLYKHTVLRYLLIVLIFGLSIAVIITMRKQIEMCIKTKSLIYLRINKRK